MPADTLGAPPALSTPDTHILQETTPVRSIAPGHLSDEDISTIYEIPRTLAEIKKHSWRRIALQFPDEMLLHSARVFQLLARRLKDSPNPHRPHRDIQQANASGPDQALNSRVSDLGIDDKESTVRLTILADTSYGSCCVDEIAAEHVEADAVVHYGRACLSPTARLPVVHVFTQQSLDHKKVVSLFIDAFPDRSSEVLLTADLPYAHHVPSLLKGLLREGYKAIFAAAIIHDPSSPVPNRTVPEGIREAPEKLKHWRLFHVSQPPTSLLLTLSCRLSEVCVYPTGGGSSHQPTTASFATNTSLILRRRYALVTSLATVPIWGILINTLSVKNYLDIVEHVKSKISAAGKKSYLFVVGKLNAAKVANFSEIGGWVVIGCWESSLVDNKDFYKPVITPFELELALRRDEERIWTGEWSANFQHILDDAEAAHTNQRVGDASDEVEDSKSERDSEEESAPPEFDLRTGRYVSQTRPMRRSSKGIIDLSRGGDAPHSAALTRRAKGDVMTVNGLASPAAQFLHSNRTWKGLGSDMEIGYEEDREMEGDAIQEGRSGIARGYVVGDQGGRT